MPKEVGFDTTFQIKLICFVVVAVLIIISYTYNTYYITYSKPIFTMT